MISKLSVFFPIFNEGRSIYGTVSQAVEVLNGNFEDWEIILVNDGSGDGTGEEISKLKKLDHRIRLISHPINRGYGAAFKSGAYAGRFDWIAFNDADGQFDFSEIVGLVAKQASTGADVVAGFYIKRSVGLQRKINTFLWSCLVKFLFNLRVRDVDCGFKLFSKKVMETIPRLESERGAFVSTEFLAKAQNSGFKIVEVGVSHYPRGSGSGTGANLNVIIKSFVDLVKLWRKLK